MILKRISKLWTDSIEISGSQGGEKKAGCLLGCCAIIRTMVALMLEAASASGTLVNFYRTTRRNNPEDNHLNSTGSGQGTVAGSYKHGSGPLGFIKLNDYQLLKKNCFM
jgi:hypothetical protein